MIMTNVNNKKAICVIRKTADVGFDQETKRFYAFFDLYVHKDQAAYVLVCQCDDYDQVTDVMKNYTVEFLKYSDNSGLDYPYDKQLFMEIELSAMEVFSDLKVEQYYAG